MKSKDRALFDAITDQIRTDELAWNLLFMGFDDIGRPHIFVVTECGRIQWCDVIGFAAIGSGAWTAQHSLARFGFNRFMSRAEAAFGLLTAKFAAESADGVGESTGFVLLTAKDRAGRTVPGLNAEDMGKVRKGWKDISRLPSKLVMDELEHALKQSEQEPRYPVADPLKGYRSVRKSRPNRALRSSPQSAS